MNADQYLYFTLRREAVDAGPVSPARGVIAILRPTLIEWAGNNFVGMMPSGSFAKGTANRSGTDIDLFISLSPTTPDNLRDIYNKLARHMTSKGYKAKPQNVSINIRVGAYDVDLVPAQRQDNISADHSLYRRRVDTWTKTNVLKHIAHVRNANRLNESRIIKLWRNQRGLEFPSFYLELTVIDALFGARVGNLSANITTVLQYLVDRFENARVIDPANTANIISEDLTVVEKTAIKRAASAALNGSWAELVK